MRVRRIHQAAIVPGKRILVQLPVSNDMRNEFKPDHPMMNQMILRTLEKLPRKRNTVYALKRATVADQSPFLGAPLYPQNMVLYTYVFDCYRGA